MDALLTGFFNKVFSEYGLAFAVLIGVIIYLAKEKNAERKERQENVNAFLEATERQTEAIKANTSSITNLSSTLAALSGRISHGNN